MLAMNKLEKFIKFQPIFFFFFLPLRVNYYAEMVKAE